MSIIIPIFVLLTNTNTDMKPKISPCGVVLEVRIDNSVGGTDIYNAFIQNDFERNKTFGNRYLDPSSLILFDEEFNKIEYFTDDLYEKIEELIEKYVVNNESQDEDE